MCAVWPLLMWLWTPRCDCVLVYRRLSLTITHLAPPPTIQYDISCSTFSPDGRIFQIEYAGKAVENSSTAVALRVKDGVVLAAEKLVHAQMMIPSSNRRIDGVDASCGLVRNTRVVAHVSCALRWCCVFVCCAVCGFSVFLCAICVSLFCH
jgi:Proteasome subunit A N-terminal signature/Proteasome subunit